jgi:microcystin-dependent protein
VSIYSQGDEGIVDVEKRAKDVEYALGDPTLFPTEFLAWIKRYIEQSGVTLPYSSIFGVPKPAPVVTGLKNVGAGIILAAGTTSAPADSLPCDGAAVSRTTYATLFAAIGTTWGVGDGSTTFNVPDLRDRALYGKGTLLAAVGGTDGGALGTRGPKHYHTTDSQGAHTHTVTDPGHTHTHNALYSPGGGSVNPGFGFGPPHGAATINSATTGISIDSGGAHTHTSTGGGVLDTPAYATVLYVITTG